MTFDTISAQQILISTETCFLDGCEEPVAWKIRLYVSDSPWDGDSSLYAVCRFHKESAEEIFKQGCEDEKAFQEDLKWRSKHGG